jgi:glutamate-ammonia-ligase adenylyltransferase
MPQSASVSAEVLDRLRSCISDAALQECLRLLPVLTADPEAALVHGERWLEAYQEEQGTTPDIMPHLDWLLPAWASGGFLSRLLVRRPWLFDSFAASEYATATKPGDVIAREIWQRVEPLHSFEELSSALRGYKQEEMFFIGTRDLAGRLTVAEVTAELSALAGSSIDAAYRFIRRSLAADYGEPTTSSGAPAAFTVLGMGKLGGCELNFSSDIDLIYLFDEEGETAGGPKGSISNSAFFHKLAVKLTAAMNDVTAEGFVFRVDMRLRPEGTQGPLVVSVAAAESYYMNWGQTWERAAMLKARPVAGDLALGDEFLAAIEGFVYRRHLDYSTVEDIKLMKQKINASLGRTVTGAWDVKLGIGGIREIEFVAQTLTLIHAGKQKSLRTRSTVEALRRFEALHLLEPGDAGMLTDAYVFHRRLEHRLQIEQERQTQRLPDAPEAHLRMARLMGYADEDPKAAVDHFHRDLERHREAVQLAYRKLFDIPTEELTQGIHPGILSVTHGEGSDADRVEVLGTLGFAQPENALASMRRLSEAPQNRHLDSKGRRYLERIIPRFLSECIASPDPDMALAHLEDFVGRVSGWSSYHSLLAENPGTLKLLVRFFGTSTFLSRFFIKHPELLDQLVLATYATPLKDATRMHMELSRAFAEAEDEERMLDVLRHYKNAEVLRIAINDIDGQLDLIEVTTQLADLADVILRRAMRMAHELVAQRLGAPPEGAELVTLGMGKFGGREMNYTSDLDLIFIYAGEGITTGGRSATMPEFFSRVVQRLISALTLVTREGLAYPIDTRLRPSGNAGPLVTSLKSFEAYHQETAAIWERQALIRARPIAGTEATATRIREVLEQAVYERPFEGKEKAEILRVRKRMETEIDPDTETRFNVKTGPGGIVDVEFFVQTLQLQHGGEYHSLRTPNTFQALGELIDLNLIGGDDYQVMREGYLFLRRLENRMRILSDTAKTTLPNDPVALEKLALSMNYPRGRQRGDAGAKLLADFLATRGNIRKVFNRFFENH